MGPDLRWYINFPNNSISVFVQLTDTFVEQFACSRKLEKMLGDLYQVQQYRDELLYDYVGRFNRKKVSIPFLIGRMLLMPSERDSSSIGSSTKNSLSLTVP